MRISAEMLLYAEQRTNPNQQRELVLRELGIPRIENMGVVLRMAGGATAGDTLNGKNTAHYEPFDVLDLSCNRLVRLENFVRATRLVELHCAGNAIESVHAENLAKNVPNLKSLTLSYNNIASLAEVVNISKACPNLEFLSLAGNPVTRRQHYRLFTIYKLPKLLVLDFEKIKPKERSRAERLAQSAAGAALARDVDVEAAAQKQSAIKTFVPGHGPGGDDDDEAYSGAGAKQHSFTDEEKDQIRELLAQAGSAREVEEIEQSVRQGVLPRALQERKQAAKPTNGDSKAGSKRPAEEGQSAKPAEGGEASENKRQKT